MKDNFEGKEKLINWVYSETRNAIKFVYRKFEVDKIDKNGKLVSRRGCYLLWLSSCMSIINNIIKLGYQS
jgi:hypothetical protein